MIQWLQGWFLKTVKRHPQQSNNPGDMLISQMYPPSSHENINNTSAYSNTIVIMKNVIIVHHMRKSYKLLKKNLKSMGNICWTLKETDLHKWPFTTRV